MIGDIPIATIVIGGILVLIITVKIWLYESAKEKKRKEEKEKYEREFFSNQRGGSAK